MPFVDLLVALGQFVMAGVEKIFQHPEQIEIHKARPVVEKNGWCVRMISNGISRSSSFFSQDFCSLRHWSMQPRPNLRSLNRRNCNCSAAGTFSCQ